MKRTKVLISFIVLVLSLIYSGRVLATELPLQITVNDTTVGEGTVILKVTNDEAIGVIKGKISIDSNIESIEISSSYNGWTTTYNEETGSFNSFYAKGISSGEVIEIKYKLKPDASNGTITLNDIALTTIEYNTIIIENAINQEVKRIENTEPGTEAQDDPNKNPESDTQNDPNKESQDVPETKPEETPKEDTKKEENPKQTNITNKSKNTVNTNTERDKSLTTNKLPKTGKTAVLFILGIAIVTACIAAIKSFKYREIK